jgi:hypothetical protein
MPSDFLMYAAMKRLLLPLLLIPFFAFPMAAVSQVDPAAVADDCRAEGEGEGLTGDGLEQFVKQCILTLLEEVDLSETTAPPPGAE